MCFLSAFTELPSDVPRFMRVRETADALDVSPSTIRTWIRTGQLPHFRIASTIRVPRTALASIATAAMRDAATLDHSTDEGETEE